MTDLLELSARIIEEGDLRVNRVSNELSEVADGVAVACQLADWALRAAPDDSPVREVHHEIYDQRRQHERSLMARGMYTDAANRTSVLLRPADVTP